MKYARTIATSIAIAVTIVLFAMWWRSYSSADRIEGVIGEDDAIILLSKQGCLGAIGFSRNGHSYPWAWRLVTAPVEGRFSFPDDVLEDHTNFAGFGLFYPDYFSTSRPGDKWGATVVLGPEWDGEEHTELLIGRGYFAPYWMFILLSVFVTAVTRWRGSFSVRLMLLVTVMISMLLVVLKLRVLDYPL